MADLRQFFTNGFGNWSFRLASGFFLLGVFVFAIGVGLLIFKENSGESEVKIISSDQVLGEAKLLEIVVDVDGAVNKPGVYSLDSDSRVNDAVAAAGGLSAEADSSRVNLAGKLSDGQKVFVPSKTQQLTIDPSTSSGLSNGQLTGQQTGGWVSINSATEGELDTLPGVGPVTAGKIIAGRPYSSIDELVSKKAVSKSVFEKIKDLITI